MILVIFVVITMIIMIIIFKPECIEDHGEEDELAQEGDDQGGGWDDLGQEEEEHCQGEQDGDGQGDLDEKLDEKVKVKFQRKSKSEKMKNTVRESRMEIDRET